MNRLAVWFGPRYSGYCTASSADRVCILGQCPFCFHVVDPGWVEYKHKQLPKDRHSPHVLKLLCCTNTLSPTLCPTHITPSPAHSCSYEYWKKVKTLKVIARPLSLILDFWAWYNQFLLAHRFISLASLEVNWHVIYIYVFSSDFFLHFQNSHIVLHLSKPLYCKHAVFSQTLTCNQLQDFSSVHRSNSNVIP